MKNIIVLIKLCFRSLCKKYVWHCYVDSFVFHSVSAFQFVREVTHDVSVESSTCSLHYNTLYSFDMSASLCPLLLLVICRMHWMRKYHRNNHWSWCSYLSYNTTSFVPVYLSTHNVSLSLSYVIFSCSYEYLLPKVFRLLLNLTSAPTLSTSRAFAGINSSLHRHPIDFTVEYVYRSLIIHLEVRMYKLHANIRWLCILVILLLLALRTFWTSSPVNIG